MVTSSTLELSRNLTHDLNREKFEFPSQIKEEALRRNGRYNEGGLCCEQCGRNRRELRKDGAPTGFQVHHLIGISIAKKFFPEISQDVLISIANTEVLCISCHTEREKELDKPNPQRSDYEEITLYVLSQFQRLNYGRPNV